MKTAAVVGLVFALAIAGTAGAARLVTGRQIKNGSIGLADLSKAAKRSLQGKAGTTGPAGAQGAAGIADAQVVSSPQVSIPPGDTSYDVELAGGPALTAQCPAGKIAIGTGSNNSIGSLGFVEMFGSFVGGFVFNDTSIAIPVSVQASCATSSIAAAASSSRSRFRSAESRAQRLARSSHG